MLIGAIFFILIVILVSLVVITYRFRALEKEHSRQNKNSNDEEGMERVILSKGFVYAALVLTIITLLICIYVSLRDTIYEAHMMEWLNIIVRLMHITFGIAWIGASFYFVFLENALNRTDNVRDELAGNLWAVHGGGFYYLEKYKIAPKTIPKSLHWFKYEAYFTWVSGFCLLFIVYYFNAKEFLIDKNVLDINSFTAIAIGIGSFVAGWLIYDILCKTPLVRKEALFAFTGFIIAIAFAYFYAHVFSGRAAYIHFGAMLGTIMAANVFFVIIPSQKAMVKAAREGKPLNPELGKNAGRRSLHNNYFTLPVLFVMISNHFPGTYGNKYSWAVLAAITLGTAGVKHYLNLREKGQLSVWVMPVSVLIILATCFLTAPKKETNECKSEISFAEVNTIIQQRCTSCHSSHPTDNTISAPPKGIVYDTHEEIVKYKSQIMQMAVVTKMMPLNNKTNITQEERDKIRCWIEQGAAVK
jgi:uncharacterized membrane protein